jgi:hypothetical protein
MVPAIVFPAVVFPAVLAEGQGPTTTTATTTSASPAPSTTTTSSGTTTTTSSTLAASRLLAASIGAANAESALEWQATLHGDGLDITELAHAGRLDGTQVITGYRDQRRVYMQLVLIGPKVYAEGNANALAYLVGMNTSASALEAAKWLVVPASAGHVYQTLAAGLTVTSATQTLNLVGKLGLVPGPVIAGQQVLGVQGVNLANGAPVTQTVYVRAKGQPLPVEVVQYSEGVVQHMTFGPWGKAPVAKAPAHAVPLKKSWLS